MALHGGLWATEVRSARFLKPKASASVEDIWGCELTESPECKLTAWGAGQLSVISGQ